MKEWPPNLELSNWIARQFPDDHAGYAIDIGASDGISVSTTYGLEEARWTVLCVEPNPCFHKRLIELRAFVEKCACDATDAEDVEMAVNFENPEAYSALRPCHPEHPPTPAWSRIRVATRTIDRLLKDWQFPRLDALCVDVEGNEVDVLRGCDLARWKPKVIVAESWDKDGPLNDYLKDRGYALAGRFVDNSLFLRASV